MIERPLYSGPYAHERVSVRRTMLLVVFALLPATLFGLYQYGWPAIFLFIVTLLAAIVAESVSLWVMGKPQRPFLLDGSALLTGWLLAITLPPWAPWWIGVVGAFVAIVIGKQVFGGIGQNLFNPAMVARSALLVSFPLEMTTFPAPQPLLSAQAPDMAQGLAITLGDTTQVDAVTSATTFGHVKTELTRGADMDAALAGTYSLWEHLLGTSSGSLGEASVLLLLLGGVLLLYTRVISWHIPVSMLGSLALLATIFHLINPSLYLDPLFHLMAGSVILGAFFIATDLVTSPVSVRGQLIFGAGCGVLVFVIRTFAGYPEGVAFAILLMNASTPLIDHYFRPRVYGRDRRGRPLNHGDGEDQRP